MSTRAWSLVAGTAVLLGTMVLSATSGTAADGKSVRADIARAADLLEKGDDAGAKKIIAALAGDKDLPLEDVMATLKLRRSKGLGVGKEPIKGVADGVESLISNLEKRAPAKMLEDHNAALVRAAYVSAVIGAIVKDHSPVKVKTGDKDPADWKKWSEDMARESTELARALKAKKPADIKAAAKKLNKTCLACHGPFKNG
jgi:hypothetical protein